jgi:hypothetical protein
VPFDEEKERPSMKTIVDRASIFRVLLIMFSLFSLFGGGSSVGGNLASVKAAADTADWCEAGATTSGQAAAPAKTTAEKAPASAAPHVARPRQSKGTTNPNAMPTMPAPAEKQPQY